MENDRHARRFSEVIQARPSVSRCSYARETPWAIPFNLFIILLIAISATSVLALRLKIPPAIVLVIAGVVLALVPGLPTVRLNPEFVLLFVLPPIIYSSAVAMSWKEFKFNLRPISLLAVGCVLFTAVATAAVSHWVLGFPWPVGFVLGAIVSPPRCGRAVVDCPTPAVAAALSGDPRG